MAAVLGLEPLKAGCGVSGRASEVKPTRCVQFALFGEKALSTVDSTELGEQHAGSAANTELGSGYSPLRTFRRCGFRLPSVFARLVVGLYGQGKRRKMAPCLSRSHKCLDSLP